MNHNRMFPHPNVYVSQDEISKCFIRFFGIDTPSFELKKNNVVMISNPDTGKIFDMDYIFCMVHNEETFTDLQNKKCFLMEFDDMISQNTILYAIRQDDYSCDMMDICFTRAVAFIDAKNNRAAQSLNLIH